ncbi:hypothetical protein BSKO_12399 [Bryopsis sp. KO-2023]|nr:hypothetical protein BSKO_12399 [Bryopsis sp. KO-2023]
MVFHALIEQPNGASRRRLARPGRRPLVCASISKELSATVAVPDAPPAPSPPPPPPASKPSSDVMAGAMARAASQSTIHPLDTLKVRMQTGTGNVKGLSKFGKLMHSNGNSKEALKAARSFGSGVASLYKGVFSAATGAGIAIGAYFAFYSVTKNVLARETKMPQGMVAFTSGAIAAAGSSVVKVPLAVCIRSVQAGVYKNVVEASGSIVKAAGPRGLFVGYLPTLLEDVPDMACKFAAYETLRSVFTSLVGGRSPSPHEDFTIGAAAGAFAAAATTPLDVIKTQMMCTAASRPGMVSTARSIYSQGGFRNFFTGVGPRAASNGINSAVFFCFFEAIRGVIATKQMNKNSGMSMRSTEAQSQSNDVMNKQGEKSGGSFEEADFSVA